MKVRENTTKVWEGKKKRSLYVKECIDFFSCIHFQNHFQLDLCIGCYVIHEQTHRLGLIFKEKIV